MKTAFALAAAVALADSAAQAAGPPRFLYANPQAVIAKGVIVPAGSETFYVSGIPGSESSGNTEAQTTEVLHKLAAVLADSGYSLPDVVNMKVYLVGDPKLDGRMDFPGMNAAFKKAFPGPNRPSRVTVQIAGLAAPGALVEIELTAAKAAK